MRDVAIVGGGPGGLHAAALLARAGLDVAVCEEHAASGAPVHCTGVLAAEAFDEFGFSRASILNTLHTARFYSPAGSHVSYTTTRPEAVAVDRLLFDQLLAGAARDAGADLIFGHRVDDLRVGTSGVAVRLKDRGELRARVCVLACGANYVLQRRLGLGFPRVYMQSAQLEVPAAGAGDVEVHFGREIAPNGFAWVVPVRRGAGWHARVGLMCERESAAHFGRFLTRVASRLGLDAEAAEPPRQKLLPLAPIERTYGSRLLAVGDAAGLVKATTGGGIYYSVLSAALAAETLLHAFRRRTFDDATLSRYERTWRRRLGAEMRAQLRLRDLAHRLNDDQIEAFFELARTDGVMPIVRRTARFNQHRDLIVALLRHPPARSVLFGRLRGRNAAPADALRHKSQI
jgi:digeranylgeranylglycerophospholipid reductase